MQTLNSSGYGQSGYGRDALYNSAYPQNGRGNGSYYLVFYPAPQAGLFVPPHGYMRQAYATHATHATHPQGIPQGPQGMPQGNPGYHQGYYQQGLPFVPAGFVDSAGRLLRPAVAATNTNTASVSNADDADDADGADDANNIGNVNIGNVNIGDHSNDFVPSDVVLADAVLDDFVPSDVVPSDIVSGDIVSGDIVSGDIVPVDTATVNYYVHHVMVRRDEKGRSFGCGFVNLDFRDLNPYFRDELIRLMDGSIGFGCTECELVGKCDGLCCKRDCAKKIEARPAHNNPDWSIYVVIPKTWDETRLMSYMGRLSLEQN